MGPHVPWMSGGFFGIGSLVLNFGKNPYEVVRGRVSFFWKNFFAPKIGKMGKKWAKNRGF